MTTLEQCKAISASIVGTVVEGLKAGKGMYPTAFLISDNTVIGIAVMNLRNTETQRKSVLELAEKARLLRVDAIISIVDAVCKVIPLAEDMEANEAIREAISEYRTAGDPSSYPDQECLAVGIKGPWVGSWVATYPYTQNEAGEYDFGPPMPFGQADLPDGVDLIPDWWATGWLN